MVLARGCPAGARGDREDGDAAAGDVLRGHAQPASVAGAVPSSSARVRGRPAGSCVVLVAWLRGHALPFPWGQRQVEIRAPRGIADLSRAGWGLRQRRRWGWHLPCTCPNAGWGRQPVGRGPVPVPGAVPCESTSPCPAAACPTPRRELGVFQSWSARLNGTAGSPALIPGDRRSAWPPLQGQGGSKARDTLSGLSPSLTAASSVPPVSFGVAPRAEQ